jgi:hypothetical protein
MGSDFMYLNLLTEMNRIDVTIEQIADALGLHRNSVSNKINGNTPWTFEEALTIRDKFFPYADIQYLFTKIASSFKLFIFA